MEAVDATV